MIRSSLLGVNTLTVRNLNVYDHLICSGPHIQSVRWRRKPIWLPTAKSKVFRIPQRPVIPIEDKLELQRLHNNYRTLMKSLYNFFIEREQNRAMALNVDVVEANREKDFEICSYINHVWNEQVSAIRKKRLAKERANREEEIFEKLEAKKERDSKLQERVDSEIRKAKEEAPTFITPENIDAAVQHAVENIVSHNYAIDLDGKYYKDEYVRFAEPKYVK